MKKVKLSIININLNNKAGLERTIQSVTSQTYSDFVIKNMEELLKLSCLVI
jgi:glycosyltransferase involved in cell wall biosynthesis